MDGEHSLIHAETIAKISVRSFTPSGWIIISTYLGDLILHGITADMDAHYSVDLQCFTWSHVGDSGQIECHTIRFVSRTGFDAFMAAFYNVKRDLCNATDN